MQNIEFKTKVFSSRNQKIVGQLVCHMHWQTRTLSQSRQKAVSDTQDYLLTSTYVVECGEKDNEYGGGSHGSFLLRHI